MLIPLSNPAHCLACQQPLLPDATARPERFCSNRCLVYYHGGGSFDKDEPEEEHLHMALLLEKVARVVADMHATVAMRRLTGTDLSADDLAGLRWLTTLGDDPIVARSLREAPPELLRQPPTPDMDFAAMLRALRTLRP